MSTSSSKLIDKLPSHPDQTKAKGWKNLVLSGDVLSPVLLSLNDLFALPLESVVYDFSCEEGWRVPNLTWQGISVSHFLKMIIPKKDVKFMTFSDGDFSTCLPVSEISAARPLLALKLNGKNIAPEHGGPCRLVTNGSKCYTSVKWVKEIKFTRDKVTDTAESIALKRIGKA